MSGLGAGIGGNFNKSQGIQRNSYDPTGQLARQWGFDVLRSPELLPTGFMSPGSQGYGGGPGIGDFSGLEGVAGQLQDLSGRGANPNATEQSGFNILDQAANLDALKRAYGSYYGSIVSPSILNTLASTGQGRSGAATEAQALAGANIGKDLAALANQRLSEAGNARLNVGSQLFGRQYSPLVAAGQLYGLKGQAGTQYNIADLTSGRSYGINLLAQLLNMLRPETTRIDTSGQQWGVSGSASAGTGGGGGTALPAA